MTLGKLFVWIIFEAMVETGERICEVQCNAPTFTVAWHPQKPLLAFACDDKVLDTLVHSW